MKRGIIPDIRSSARRIHLELTACDLGRSVLESPSLCHILSNPYIIVEIHTSTINTSIWEVIRKVFEERGVLREGMGDETRSPGSVSFQ
jgi:hypothetical protein